MDGLLIEIAKQVPSMVGLIIVVVFFLRQQREMSDVSREIARECHQHQQRATDAL